MKRPQDFPRRVLLAVTGLSPQVVTETLYALAVAPPEGARFVPTEVHLITTAEGAEHARLMLLDPGDGRYFELCQEHGLAGAGIAFDESHIHVVPGADGQPLADITNEADNTAVADFISERVRAFTADGESALHASIAGGRKTMGFYLGYALSLYGRPQDRLTHVLVSRPFEADHQFYFPPARPRRLIIRDRPVHTSEARVMLADIPFVRLRDGLPERLQQGGASYSQTVAAAQKALEPPLLEIDLARGRVLASGEPVDLQGADLACYLWLAQRRLEGAGPVRGDEPGLAQEYLRVYGRIKSTMSGPYERIEEALGRGTTVDWLGQRRSRVNKALRHALDMPLARAYLIESYGKRPHTRHGLGLSPDQIRIRDHARSLRAWSIARAQPSRSEPKP
jgi:CRISPR-associated protein (TIGR02584 family)